MGRDNANVRTGRAHQVDQVGRAGDGVIEEETHDDILFRIS
jgi:hypothetical protein